MRGIQITNQNLILFYEKNWQYITKGIYGIAYSNKSDSFIRGPLGKGVLSIKILIIHEVGIVSIPVSCSPNEVALWTRKCIFHHLPLENIQAMLERLIPEEVPDSGSTPVNRLYPGQSFRGSLAPGPGRIRGELEGLRRQTHCGRFPDSDSLGNWVYDTKDPQSEARRDSR